MCDVRERVMLATFLQKDVFDHNFWTKTLRMTILVSRSVSQVKESDGAIYCAYDLDLVRSWPLQNHISGYISVSNG